MATSGLFLKIVTVDDSPIVAERIQSILSQVNNVAFAGNATSYKTAQLLIDDEKPDVVILDINLEVGSKDMNGINLLIELRKKYKGMKIIMLTNLSHAQYRTICLSHGADFFLDKSNEFEKIAEIVGNLN